ncbi:unnamed protein product [Phytophthora lilii]|uniref:Unnamed protein product n=1 Tax=Phytophthora lilii TaxID=2077276 RepID=A0A9W6TEV0_9STRA|nr:unnamed protein product [Phytophthora lilii]
MIEFTGWEVYAYEEGTFGNASSGDDRQTEERPTVLTLDFAPDLGPEGLLVSGSADRSIKVWDPWSSTDSPLPTKSGYSCVQTLTEHFGSVVCLRVLTHHNHGIVSCSLDRTVRTWYPADGRALLLYPWYVPAQSISQPGSSWPSAFCVRSGANGTLFVGDSAGGISVYRHTSSREVPDTALEGIDNKQLDDQVDPKFQFGLKRKFSHFHSLGISKLCMVADNCFVVSLGFDEKAQVIDAISGSLSSTICSASAARFISCSWDDRGQILLLGDTAGYVHLWNIFEDKLLGKKQIVAAMPLTIIGMHFLTGTSAGDFLFTGLENGIKQWLCDRNVGYVNCDGHSDAVVSVVVMNNDINTCNADEGDPGSKPNKKRREMVLHGVTKSTETFQFFSASLDGTIRCWDSYEMKVSFGFEEKNSDITCMVASKQFQKIFTGHDAGFVKVWSIHAGELLELPLQGNGSITCLAGKEKGEGRVRFVLLVLSNYLLLAGVVRDQEILLAGSIDGYISMWEVNYDEISRAIPFQIALQPEKKVEVTSIAFCKGIFLAEEGQEFVAVGYFSGQIAIWSFAKKATVWSFKAHSDAVCSLALHGCFLFSGSDDTLIRMWNMFNLPETYELGVLRPPSSPSSSGSGSPIVCLDVVPMRGLVLSAAADGTLIIWDYTCFDDENAFDAYGKVVFSAKCVDLLLIRLFPAVPHYVSFANRVDGCIKCLQCWPECRSMICGTAEGKLLVFDLPPDPKYNSFHGVSIGKSETASKSQHGRRSEHQDSVLHPPRRVHVQRVAQEQPLELLLDVGARPHDRGRAAERQGQETGVSFRKTPSHQQPIHQTAHDAQAAKLHELIKSKQLEDKIQVVRIELQLFRVGDQEFDVVVAQIITSPLTRAIETTIGTFPDTKIPIIGEMYS